MTNTLDMECRVLTKYLIGEQPTERMYSLYKLSHDHLDFNFSDREQKLWNRCMRSSFMLYFTDAALAGSNSAIRRKLLTGFAILESLPEYHQHFLCTRSNAWGLLSIPFHSLKAMLASIFGKLLLLFIK